MTDSKPPSGWHRDPYDSGQLRWWDGERWSAHVHGVEKRPRGRGRRLAFAGGLGLIVIALAATFLTLAASGSGTERILFEGPDGESLRMVNTDGSEYERLVTGLTYLWVTDVSKDTGRAAVTYDEGDESLVAIMDPATGEMEEIGYGTFGIVSDDGRYLAYTTNEDREDIPASTVSDEEIGQFASHEGVDHVEQTAVMVDLENLDRVSATPGTAAGLITNPLAMVVARFEREESHSSSIGLSSFDNPGFEHIVDGQGAFLAPDGRHLATTQSIGDSEEYHSGIAVYTIDGDEVMRADSGYVIRWSEDSRYLYYNEEEIGWVRRLDIETGEDIGVGEGSLAAVSPTREEVIFERTDEDTFESRLFQVDVETGEEVSLGKGSNPQYTSDGNQLVLVRDRGSDDWDPVIYTIDLESGEEVEITPGQSPHLVRSG